VSRALVIGLAATGEAVARALRRDGWDVVVTDDRPGGAAYEQRRSVVGAVGAEVVEHPTADSYARLVGRADLVVPSPLVNEAHPAVVAARAAGVPVRSEIDLAAERARAPIVAVTGTNGKTTVTSLTAAMLHASGRSATAAGNIGRTLLEAADDHVDVLVAEVSSFQLAFTETFRPRVAVLLALAEDHLDWHGTFDDYVAAKSRIFARQRVDDLLVFDGDDPVATRAARGAPAARVAVHALARSDDDAASSHVAASHAGAYHVAAYHIADGELRAPDGHAFATLADMRRALPHDRTNALAAAAAAFAMGATEAGVRAALARYETMPHRVALVGEHGGVRYIDDSKATNPHATVHAVAAFDAVVLLAGGRNKGLDLTELARAPERIRAVVAFGEAAPEIEAAFTGVRPVVAVTSMRDAVREGARLARAGDVVLLSPACASFDAYPNYAARGDDFAQEVHALIAASEAGAR
jgi:UDP-N-acetylmuramoylalanine--D-glutamate ligase